MSILGQWYSLRIILLASSILYKSVSMEQESLYLLVYHVRGHCKPYHSLLILLCCSKKQYHVFFNYILHDCRNKNYPARLVVVIIVIWFNIIISVCRQYRRKNISAWIGWFTVLQSVLGICWYARLFYLLQSSKWFVYMYQFPGCSVIPFVFSSPLRLPPCLGVAVKSLLWGKFYFNAIVLSK